MSLEKNLVHFFEKKLNFERYQRDDFELFTFSFSVDPILDIENLKGEIEDFKYGDLLFHCLQLLYSNIGYLDHKDMKYQKLFKSFKSYIINNIELAADDSNIQFINSFKKISDRSYLLEYLNQLMDNQKKLLSFLFNHFIFVFIQDYSSERITEIFKSLNGVYSQQFAQFCLDQIKMDSSNNSNHSSIIKIKLILNMLKLKSHLNIKSQIIEISDLVLRLIIETFKHLKKEEVELLYFFNQYFNCSRENMDMVKIEDYLDDIETLISYYSLFYKLISPMQLYQSGKFKSLSGYSLYLFGLSIEKEHLIKDNSDLLQHYIDTVDLTSTKLISLIPIHAFVVREISTVDFSDTLYENLINSAHKYMPIYSYDRDPYFISKDPVIQYLDSLSEEYCIMLAETLVYLYTVKKSEIFLFISVNLLIIFNEYHTSTQLIEIFVKLLEDVVESSVDLIAILGTDLTGFILELSGFSYSKRESIYRLFLKIKKVDILYHFLNLHLDKYPSKIINESYKVDYFSMLLEKLENSSYTHYSKILIKLQQSIHINNILTSPNQYPNINQIIKDYNNSNNSDNVIKVANNNLKSLNLSILNSILTFSLNDSKVTTKWIVELSTVSREFHKICSTIISNSTTRNINISSIIDHMGSTFCLFKNPPLRIYDTELGYIPKEFRQQCLKELVSLTSTFNLNTLYYGFLYVHLLDTPNIQEITFSETDNRNYNLDICKVVMCGNHFERYGKDGLPIKKKNKEREIIDKHFLRVLLEHYTSTAKHLKTINYFSFKTFDTHVNHCVPILDKFKKDQPTIKLNNIKIISKINTHDTDLSIVSHYTLSKNSDYQPSKVKSLEKLKVLDIYINNDLVSFAHSVPIKAMTIHLCGNHNILEKMKVASGISKLKLVVENQLDYSFINQVFEILSQPDFHSVSQFKFFAKYNNGDVQTFYPLINQSMISNHLIDIKNFKPINNSHIHSIIDNFYRLV